MKRWKIFPMKIAFPSRFSFRFYLQATSFINTMYRINFITVFLNMFNDPLKCWCFYISLDVFLMVDTFISGLWWSWGRYCYINPLIQCTSINADWWCSKETKRSVPTNTQLFVKTENQWLFFATCNLFTAALVIKEVKNDWNEKIKPLQKKGYNEKVLLQK